MTRWRWTDRSGFESQKKGNHQINVSACHGFRLKCPSGSLRLQIKTSNLAAIGFISWTDATPRDRDRRDEMKQRCETAHVLSNSPPQPAWARPGGPIQTTSLCSGAPSPLKQSQTLFIYCRPAFGLVPCNTLTQRGEAVETCIQERKEWAIVSLSTAGWVSVGFIIFSTYWHVQLVAPLNLYDASLHKPPALLNNCHSNFLQSSFIDQ